jgi:outer membrane protein OmpA-like peptidoglycan-associated protein
MGNRKLIGLCCLFFTLARLCAQNEAPISLVNPSFEADWPGKTGVTPNGWFDCGLAGESPPDIQPGAFSVVQTPSKGTSCLGLVVRDNNTSEGISQRLERSLEQGKCYEWSLDICRSKHYLSLSKKTNQEANYNQPVKVRLWGGNGFCDRSEMLYETPLIDHHNWKKYTAKIQSRKGTYSYIIIEVDFDDAAPNPYNGNVLLDNLSSIRPVACAVTAAAAQPLKKDADKLTRVRLDFLLFDINSDELRASYEPLLQEIVSYLEAHPTAFVEIAGHTSNNADAAYAQALSLKRAQAVASFLQSAGIDPARFKTEGFGKTQPLLPNYIPESRVKNQRVEVSVWH